MYCLNGGPPKPLISITNYGIGIATEDQQFVFEPFRRIGPWYMQSPVLHWACSLLSGSSRFTAEELNCIVKWGTGRLSQCTCL
jgi:hypothetical protein